MQLPHIPLIASYLTLEPYSDSNKADVQAALDCDAEAWNVFSLSGQGEYFAGWWQRLTDGMHAGTWLPYAMREHNTGKVIGTTSFLNPRPERQTVEIGGTFIHPAYRSALANPESKLLMLTHAFNSGARRVELLTDSRNLRSQAALTKLGALREGVLRRDRITWTGHVRDSVIYAITDLEWPSVRECLLQRLQSP
jgi:N-acetyltransferase